MNTDKIYAEAIANEYSPKETSKVIALKKLDRKAKSKANIFAYTFGVAMTLILGLGMCLSMQVIGDGSAMMTGIGIVLGILGLAGVGVNYSIYQKLLRTGKEKYAFEIIQLAKDHQVYWSAKYSPLVGAVQEWIYDLYLKGNKIDSGRQNYSEVVGLLISYETARSAENP